MTDEKLIHAVRAGNDHAFRDLVKRYESCVAATVVGMLGKCPESEDVGQETFIRFFKNIHHFRMESSVKTYLTRIAINLSLNELKRRKRRMGLFVRHQPGQSSDIPELNDQEFYTGEKEAIQRAIQKLDPKFRSVLVLRLMTGYSTQETADILQLPLGTALSRLARAQKKLQELLLPYWEGIQ